MTLTVTPIPAFTDNYIWVIYQGSANDRVVVVDPGDATVVEDFLLRTNATLDAILVTHWHPDHTGGIATLLANRNIPVIGPDSAHIPQVTHKVVDGDTIELLGARFQVLEVPGHTLDHIAFHHQSRSQSLLFCGDTLFSSGCGRVFEGTAEMLWKSINKFKQLPENTYIYCTHEYTLSNLKFAIAVEPNNPQVIERQAQVIKLRQNNMPSVPTTLADELKFNPFLRCDQNSIKKSVFEAKNVSECDESIIFAALRGWKDTF